MNTSRRTRVHHAPAEFTAHCDRCARSFVNDRALEQHTRHSSMHNVCSGCDFDYITPREMEECDCNESEEDEESDEYYEYGSAGTLSDDGGGHGYGSGGGGGVNIGLNRLHPTYSSTPSSAFSHTHYSIPGAWNGGTRTDSADEFTRVRDRVNTMWGRSNENEVVYAESSEFESGSDSEVIYLGEDSDIPPEETTEEETEEYLYQRDGGVATRTETPYCQRCNREFHTLNGLHQHCRMSSLHPWYCWPCRMDFDREVDMENHVVSHHGNAAQGTSRQQQPQATMSMALPPSELSRVERITEFFGRRSRPVDAGTSTSTIGPVPMGGAFPPGTIPDSPPIRDPNERRPPRLLQGLPQLPPPSPPPAASAPTPGETVSSGGGTSGKPLLVVSCPLCLEDVTALTTTLCGHVFCKECITAAIQHKPECPVCRAFTHIRSLHPIFLNVISS